jgi:RNA polymerase sigma factor (TIGR02999 family)
MTIPRADHADGLFAALYAELSRMARRELRRRGADALIGTGTLVHEAWLAMGQRPSLRFDQRDRFLAYAARTMRGLIIDRLRSCYAQKRGGGLQITTLDTSHGEQAVPPAALASVGAALDELAVLDPQLANVVDLKFFCGFTLVEIAAMHNVSERTVQRHWEKARLLLHRALEP